MPAICRAAVAKSGDSVLPDTQHAPVLLPVPGRSRDKPRSYDEAVRGMTPGFLRVGAMLGRIHSF